MVWCSVVLSRLTLPGLACVPLSSVLLSCLPCLVLCCVALRFSSICSILLFSFFSFWCLVLSVFEGTCSVVHGIVSVNTTQHTSRNRYWGRVKARVRVRVIRLELRVGIRDGLRLRVGFRVWLWLWIRVRARGLGLELGLELGLGLRFVSVRLRVKGVMVRVRDNPTLGTMHDQIMAKGVEKAVKCMFACTEV